MKKKTPFLTQTLKKLAPLVGAKLVVEPEWQYAGQIQFKNGVKKYLRFYSLDLNTIAASDIARDKGFARFFMKRAGYPVAEGKTFFKDSWAKAIGSKDNVSAGLAYAKKLGYPVIAKPNSRSQGTGVTLAHNAQELRKALSFIFTEDKVAIVEEYRPGADYRIVVLDDKVISAYERQPLSVVGDGTSTIARLLKKKQSYFIAVGRDTKLDFTDPRMLAKLRRQKLSLKSILPKGQKIVLLENANLSDGGDSVDVTETMHSGFRTLAIALAREMGLRMTGIDLMIEKGSIEKPPVKNGYYFIEINATPGLDHYASTGKKQKKIVEDMYLEILKAMAKK